MEAGFFLSPEEDVPGLVTGVGMHQLLLQLFKRTVVDVDWAVELSALSGALLRNLPAEVEVEFCPLWFRELHPLSFPNI